ncbi:MAG: hypothetical protein P8Z78_06660, partial [Gammaproteobacteria bacterium]
SNFKLWSDREYDLTLVLFGSSATLYVDQGSPLVFDFMEPLNDDGMLGLGTDNAVASFDDYQVQKLPPAWTKVDIDAFDTTASLVSPVTGSSWTVDSGRYVSGDATLDPELAIGYLDVAAYTQLEMAATLQSTADGGLVFDYYNANDFKFVSLDVANDRLIIGHMSGGKYTEDASVDISLDAGSDYELTLQLFGGAVSVLLDGQAVLSYTYNSLLNDGGFGLLSKSGVTSVDELVIKSDDPAFTESADSLTAATGASVRSDSTDTLATAELGLLGNEAIRRLDQMLGLTVEQRSQLESVSYQVTDLPGDLLAQTTGNQIMLDMDAAGHGWFVDPTPGDDSEFVNGSALPSDDAFGNMDLLSVIGHELGHMLDLSHDSGFAFMDSKLLAGERTLSVEQAMSASTDQTGEGKGIAQNARVQVFDELLDEWLELNEARLLAKVSEDAVVDDLLDGLGKPGNSDGVKGQPSGAQAGAMTEPGSASDSAPGKGMIDWSLGSSLKSALENAVD